MYIEYELKNSTVAPFFKGHIISYIAIFFYFEKTNQQLIYK